jgi:hypothetical protein
VLELIHQGHDRSFWVIEGKGYLQSVIEETNENEKTN